MNRLSTTDRSTPIERLPGSVRTLRALAMSSVIAVALMAATSVPAAGKPIATLTSCKQSGNATVAWSGVKASSLEVAFYHLGIWAASYANPSVTSTKAAGSWTFSTGGKISVTSYTVYITLWSGTSETGGARTFVDSVDCAP